MKDQWYYWRGDTLLLKVHTSPQSRRNEICGIDARGLHVKLTAPPVDGKANWQLIDMLAEEFKTAKTRVTIAAGARGRNKLLAIAGPGCMPDWFVALSGKN